MVAREDGICTYIGCQPKDKGRPKLWRKKCNNAEKRIEELKVDNGYAHSSVSIHG